ncbi:MAG: alpha/beta hydrolase [Bacteroidales bacterium]
MKTIIITGLIFGSAMLIPFRLIAQHQSDLNFEIPYGDNSKVGKYLKVNGINLYYETYGEGNPLLLIHGNGGTIKNMGYQIEYFSDKYKVIIPDCRGRGKSELNTDSLTFEQITNDLILLLDNLGIDSCDLIGWSDGGIIGLLMGMNYPDRTKKIIAMGANLWHDSTALYPWVIEWIQTSRQEAAKMIRNHDSSEDWQIIYQRMALMDDQPNIDPADLQNIKSPVLIIAGDRDMIREEHSVLIYQNIPKSQLWIIPAGTHFAPINQSELFNETVYRFLREPFVRPDSKF